MSLQTTLARAQARAAEQAWKAHRWDCVRCSLACKPRSGVRPCDAGTCLKRDRDQAAAELGRSRELDKLPSPGQQTLF